VYENDYENEEEQLATIFCTIKQLKVLLKISRHNFIGLVEAFKRKSLKNVGFKFIKLWNFDGLQDQKVINAWIAKMEDYLHVVKVGQQSIVQLAQSYLKDYGLTWWRTMRQEEGKTHGYTWEFFKECIE